MSPSGHGPGPSFPQGSPSHRAQSPGSPRGQRAALKPIIPRDTGCPQRSQIQGHFCSWAGVPRESRGRKELLRVKQEHPPQGWHPGSLSCTRRDFTRGQKSRAGSQLGVRTRSGDSSTAWLGSRGSPGVPGAHPGGGRAAAASGLSVEPRFAAAAAPAPAQGSTSPVNQHLIKGHADIWKSETSLLCGLPLSAARLFSESLPDILPD